MKALSCQLLALRRTVAEFSSQLSALRRTTLNRTKSGRVLNGLNRVFAAADDDFRSILFDESHPFVLVFFELLQERQFLFTDCFFQHNGLSLSRMGRVASVCEFNINTMRNDAALVTFLQQSANGFAAAFTIIQG